MKSRTYPSLKKIPVSVIFDALSDPVRLEIFCALLEQDEISCGKCKSTLSKSTMSHHFKVLTQAGLIQRREEGTIHFLSVRKEEVDRRLPGLLALLRQMKGPL